MRHWFKDRHLKSLLKNSSYLAASKAVAGVAGLATLAFAGRSLGVTMFGMLILIVSYSRAASELSKFQSWQLIVRYGGQAMVPGEASQFKASIGFAFALDVVSGFGGMMLAILLLPLIGELFGITEKYLVVAMLYCTLLPTTNAASPMGVLRSLDRFDLIAWQGSTYAIARAILSGIAWWFEAPFEAFVAIWYATELAGDLFLWVLAWRELKRRDLFGGIRPTLKPQELTGAWRFAIHVNLTSGLVAAGGPIARLVVGGLLGPAAAGIYQVAYSLAKSAKKPAGLVGAAYYPEIVRMDLTTAKPWELMWRVTVLATLIGGLVILILLVGGRPLIDAIFGSEFVPAYPVLLVLIIAPLLTLVSFPLTPTLYALDRPDGPMKANLLGTIIYLGAVAPLSWQFGVVGAAMAFVIGRVAVSATLALQVAVEYRRVRSL